MMTRKIASGKRTLMQQGRKGALHLLAVCGFMAGAGMMQSCEKDVLTGQPEWLGNSIYERLQEGITTDDGQHRTFNTTLRLINDLGYTEVLSKTGSRTLFVSSDADYEEWFKTNNWGVSSYDDLTEAQKKQLFNSTMINDAYLISLMSNVNGNPPKEGLCMRRETAASIYDYVPTYLSTEMPRLDYSAEEMPSIDDEPVNKAWSRFISEGRDIRIFKDDSETPMIHFLPDFMKKNNIVDEDLQTISNGASESINDSWINGKKVISTEQTCKNGYIYVVDGVMGLNKSMAEIIHEDPQLSIWSSMLKRWSCPMPVGRSVQENFRRLYNTTDSVYSLRYLNSSGNHQLLTPTGNDLDALNATGVLKFDPGWNRYIADNSQIDMHYDAGAMIVPTNEALQEWFENGAGKSLKERFGTFDKIPYITLVKLLNVNMLESFTSSVPSKFVSVLDEVQRQLGIKAEDVKRCYMGCNGVVYVVDKVFAPSEYSSVLYPANIHSTGAFSVAYIALTGAYSGTQESIYDFSPYLTAMDSRFSLVIPYNNAGSYSDTEGTASGKKVVRYLDPCTYGLPKQVMMEFFVEKGKVTGYKYNCTIGVDENGDPLLDANGNAEVTVDVSSRRTIPEKAVPNRLFDYIDNATLIEDIVPGKEYYKTKSGGVMRAYQKNGKLCLQGGYQMGTGENIEVESEGVYVMGNGTTYGVSTAQTATAPTFDLPLTASKSVYQMLKERADAGGDHLFYDLLYSDESARDKIEGMTSALTISKDGKYYCANSVGGNTNISVFDNYNYTVYVPTDEKIQEMIDAGQLPTWNDYLNATHSAEKKVIADRIHNFLRYHIQDNAVYVKGDVLTGDDGNGQLFESSKLNPKNNRFYSMKVYANNGELTVKDQVHATPRKVLVSGGFYNKPCREMWLNSQITNTSNPVAANVILESSSYAVLHEIDGVLIYDNSQLTDWATEAREAVISSASSKRK